MSDDFDLEDVSEDQPVSAVRRIKNLGKFIELLNRSWETDVALGVNVPASKVKHVDSRLRQAAGELGIGVAIAHRDPSEDGSVRVVFQAKEKRQYKPRKPKTAATGGKAKK